VRELLLVGGGGFIGSIGRYLLGGWAHSLFPRATFPLGTLLVNVCGCLLIGLVAGLIEIKQMFGPEVRLFVLIGLLGGFTTFSTFSYETLAMLRDGQFLRALGNVMLQVVLCLVAAWLGYLLARY